MTIDTCRCANCASDDCPIMPQ